MSIPYRAWCTLRRAAVFIFFCSLSIVAARADDWIELRTPYFTVVSEASESRTRAWATEFELFRRAMMLVMPVDKDAVEPVTLVLFRSDRRLKPFKPMENGKAARVAGYFLRVPGRNFLALAIEGARDDVREIIFHEGVHWHLKAAARPVPLWMEEGLAEVFGNFALKGNAFVIGSHRPAYVRYVRIAKPMPFTQLAGMGANGLTYNGKHGEQTELFYYQSWAMMHALLFGINGIGQPAFSRFLSQPMTTRDQAREIETVLGVKIAGMDQRLTDHLEARQYKFMTIPFDRSAVEAGFALRPLSAAEADLTLGNLLVGVDRPDEGEPYLRRAAQALPEDPRVLDALGIMSYAQEKSDAAVEYFRDASRHGGQGYIGHYLIALHEMKAITTFSFGAPDATKMVESLLACLRIRPQFQPAHEALASVVTWLPERSKDAEASVRTAAQRYPANYRILAGLALLEATHGELDAAQLAVVQAQMLPQQTDPMAHRLLEQATALIDKRGGKAAPSSIVKPLGAP